MKWLHVSDVGGLYAEFFNPDHLQLQSRIDINGTILDGAGCFWHELFQPTKIKSVIKTLRDNIHADQWQSPQYLSIAADPEKFIDAVVSAPQRICEPRCNVKQFFSCVESLSILCKLYSDFEFAPFILTVQDGFRLDSVSSNALYQNCLNPQKNPYHSFVIQKVLPVLLSYAPDIVFLDGPLSYYLAAIAVTVKHQLPNVHVCLTRHSSEYYSLNKIAGLLTKNHSLFEMVDSVILEFFEETESVLARMLSEGKSLADVPNVLYKDKGGHIIETKFQPPENPCNMEIYNRSAASTTDVHLEPFSKCHWNKCSFCGINKKYHFEDRLSSPVQLEEKIKAIKRLSKDYAYIWFVDEALQPNQLRALAKALISKDCAVFWQARCRASLELLNDGLPELLSQSGLRELRIGLESASYTVLQAMCKFEPEFRLEWMKRIISAYSSHGISIHCPMILGFPGEDIIDRRKTYEFLTEMHEQHPTFTFNLNILSLDVSSDLYRNWAKYGIKKLEYICPPNEFLGNSVMWMSADMIRTLDMERQKYMRAQLYPWMPQHSLVKPTVLYRLSETSRRTLEWKATGTWNYELNFSLDLSLELSPNLTIARESEDKYLVYDWESHHYMQGNRPLISVLCAFQKPKSSIEAIELLVKESPDIFQSEELSGLILRLFKYGYLVLANAGAHYLVKLPAKA